MAYLRIFIGDTLLEQRELTDARTTIGRADDNAIVLSGRGVSKHHAVIEQCDGQFVFVDCDSANGSFLRGQPISRRILDYWDEIHVFNYVLKFMAVARAKGEEIGAPEWSGGAQEHEETMELDIASLADLRDVKRRASVAAVNLYNADGNAQRIELDKVNFVIGRARDSDVATRGWWSPRVAARIQRRNDGFYLQAGRRGHVRLNNKPIDHPVRLCDSDWLSVRGISLQFLFRPRDERRAR